MNMIITAVLTASGAAVCLFYPPLFGGQKGLILVGGLPHGAEREIPE